MKRKTLLLLFPLFLLLALTLAPTAGAAENDVYAILYTDKTLVFQYGDAPESGKTVREKYQVSLDGYGKPQWYNRRTAVKEAIFKDEIQPLSMAYWFCDCSALESVQGLGKVDTSHVTNMSGLFSGCSKFVSMDLRGLNTSSVENMLGMFENCARLASLDVSDWDTSHVKDMSRMFNGCEALASLDVSRWDTANVTSMHYLFIGCEALASLDVSRWDTANVTSMYGMFCGCKALASLDVSRWDTSAVTWMSNMFVNCYVLTALDLSGFDTSAVTDMSSMFSCCYALKTLDLSGWDTGAVQNMEYMFAGCESLQTIYASEAFSDAQRRGGLFSDCPCLVGGAGTRYDENNLNYEYGRIDNPPDEPGYFTYKAPPVVRPPATLALTLRDSSGNAVTMSGLRDGAEIKPEITVENASESEWKTADIFLVIYDSQGMMIDLQSWEVDLSQPLSFIRTAPIPQNRDASYVKFIMLSSNLTPLTAAQALQ